MFVRALATDYDGTLATEGKVEPATVAALERVAASGRKLILVTGRVLPELRGAFSRLDLFARVVAENGALIYRPATGAEEALANPPPASFFARLRDSGATPLSAGRIIVATRVPHDVAMRAAMRDLGLDLRLIHNAGAVMALPPGITKASGLGVALAELEIPPRDVVAVGDAENDQEFLAFCGYRVAVANALPVLKEMADWVTSRPCGAGVVELAERLLATDLAELRRAR